MKIGIEGSSFQNNPGGIGKYVLSLFQLLLTTYPDVDFIIYSNKEVHLTDEISQRVKVVQDKSIFRHLNPTVWLKTIAGLIIAKDDLDYYLSGAGLLPKLKKKTQTVSVIHDLNYKIVPQTMGILHCLSHQLFLKKDIKKADFIICNSKGTSEKIFQYTGKKVNTIINPPTGSRFKALPSLLVEEVLQKYNINYPYFLTVGTIEPRKNLQMTIDVFIKLLTEYKNGQYKLIIVGSNGWKNKKIIDLCKKYKENIICIGYIQDSDLPALYNGAAAFLFPSLYEGFGMPAREALYCGKQIITSDIVELRESCLNQAIFIDPHNSIEYEHALLSVIKNSEKGPNIVERKKESDTTAFIDFFRNSGQIKRNV